jgi:ferredoxin--NADP+ reductase
MTLRVAVVGSGPSAFYAAEALLESGRGVEVAMLERLPAPFGLVRSGVAPDHPRLKQPIRLYEQVARMPGFRYYGNVEVGRDVSAEELRHGFHAVIFAYGAARDVPLGIPGEDLPGSHTATEFVGWYNGHPDYRECHFDLSQEAVAIVGQGNVALDVARILAKPVDELRHTDIAAHALEALSQSRVREVRIIGRRGPAQAKFTPRELEELGSIDGCDVAVSAADLRLNAASAAEIADRTNPNAARNLGIFGKLALSPPGGTRIRCYFNFLESPVAIRGEGRVERLVLRKNALAGEPFRQSAVPTAVERELPCGLVFRAIGYRGEPIPGVPFDPRKGVIPNRDGRVVDDGDAVQPGLYTAGWIKRGANGIIGTNRADAVATVDALLADCVDPAVPQKPGAAALQAALEARGVRYVTYDGWRRLDAIETQRGEAHGKPREKLTRIDEMLALSMTPGTP